MPELQNPVLVGFYEPGLKQQIQAGKFVAIGSSSGPKWVYQNNVGPGDLMEVLDAWGVAPCVLKAMREYGVLEVHYYALEENQTYIATPQRVWLEGIKQAHGRRGTYFHLPRKLWDRFEGRIAQYPWASQRLTLQWIEPEDLGAQDETEGIAQVEQLEMAL